MFSFGSVVGNELIFGSQCMSYGNSRAISSCHNCFPNWSAGRLKGRLQLFCVNSLPDDKSLDTFRLKMLAKDNLIKDQITALFINKGRKLVGRRENVVLLYFFFAQKCFHNHFS